GRGERRPGAEGAGPEAPAPRRAGRRDREEGARRPRDAPPQCLRLARRSARPFERRVRALRHGRGTSLRRRTGRVCPVALAGPACPAPLPDRLADGRPRRSDLGQGHAGPHGLAVRDPRAVADRRAFAEPDRATVAESEPVAPVNAAAVLFYLALT